MNPAAAEETPVAAAEKTQAADTTKSNKHLRAPFVLKGALLNKNKYIIFTIYVPILDQMGL